MRSNRGHTQAVICQHCGQTYWVKPYELGRTRYCSFECRCAGHTIDPQMLLARGTAAPDKNGCRLWQKAAREGYGAIRVNKRMVGTHVYAFALANNIPLDDVRRGHVQHLCDRFYPPGDITYRRCVEPGHLMLGNHTANMRHMIEVGRQARNVDYKWKRGVTHHAAKLTETDVLAMRAAAATGIDAKALGRQYGISHQSAWRIIKHLSWTHI